MIIHKENQASTLKELLYTKDHRLITYMSDKILLELVKSTCTLYNNKIVTIDKCINVGK